MSSIIYRVFFRKSPKVSLRPTSIDLVAAKVILLLVTNLAGALTHYPSELAKRQAFLETRQCVKLGRVLVELFQSARDRRSNISIVMNPVYISSTCLSYYRTYTNQKA
ncbi:unnamed protein product [Nezara viridula]|uniref:Adenylate cyclase N-terminal domain-containing protein n=1 Tax=Nezara viridula TaxID=85310 RepID=A0A9P0H5F6_NEZVI|nr:unnamed protein product [Nezara viridula]